MKIKILGVIPARYGSSRFPGKPLAKIFDKPMIRHVYEQVKLSRVLNNIIVATDDEKILNCVKDFGGNAMMTPSDLPNGTTRAELVSRNFDVDAVINIQGDEPLLDPIMIDEVAEMLEAGNYCATLCRNLNDDRENPNIVKVVLSQNNFALYFSRSLIPYERNKINSPIYQHIGIYGYTKEFLKKYISLPETPLSNAESLEQLKILEHDYKIKVGITKSKKISIGVDTPEDLEQVRKILQCK